MSSAGDYTPVVSGRDISKTFRRDTGEVVKALDAVSLEAGQGMLTALVGPDGAGKTTLLRLAAGLMTADAGELRVLGVDVAADPQQVQERIGYMPQKFGLYEDLTVQENLDLYADLHGVLPEERREKYLRLMEMTALGPFTARLAGRLSGGMKQKLGLACTLVRSPELLLLDEPTVGVDPLSRRELWEIILQLVHDQGMTVLLSTSYLDEAERCGHVVILHEGMVLAQGRPADVSGLAASRTFLAEPPAGTKARGLQARLLDDPNVVDAVPEGGRVRFIRTEEGVGNGHSLGNGPLAGIEIEPEAARFEDGFMVLLKRAATSEAALAGAMTLERPLERRNGEAVVEVRDLVRQFGTFTAVDHVSFEVHSGEIFGLLGPNGAGKTTTFRMLCGLLPASEGALRVAGVDLRHARAAARQQIGYVAQKFSLYGQLSVTENTAGTATGYVGAVVEAFNDNWRKMHGQAGPPIRVATRAWYNPNLESRWNMIPGLIGTLTMMQVLLLTAMSIAREREQGTFDQLLVTPFRPAEIMACKVFPAMLIGTVQATMVLLVAQLWFRIPFAGSYVPLYAGLVLFLLAAAGIGLFVSSIAATMQQAMLFSFVLMMPFMLMSGLTTPISGMPQVLQYSTLINPLRYAIDVTQRVYLEGAGFDQLVPDLWPLAVIALLTLSAASWMFRHRLI
jgi:ABC-2 type transport system ATP-binding protein